MNRKLRTALVVLALSAVPLGLLYAVGPRIPVQVHRMLTCRVFGCSLAGDLSRACEAVTTRVEAGAPPSAVGDALLDSFWTVDGVGLVRSIGLAAPDAKLGLWRAAREKEGQPPCPAVERLFVP